MYSREQISSCIKAKLVWTLFAQLGLLCGIEGVYLATFWGIVDFEKAYGNPSISTIGLSTSMYPIMAAVGALVALLLARVVSDNMLLICALYTWLAGYLLGSIGFGRMGLLIAGRALKGLAIGAITSAIPVYAERVAATRQRAAQLLTLFQAAVPLGILLMALVGKLVESKSFTLRWVYVAIPVFPACLFVFYIPGARAHVQHQGEYSTKQQLSQLKSIKDDFKQLVRSKAVVMRFVAASLAQCAGPLTAINIVFYYSSSMGQLLGFAQREAGFIAIGLYGCNFVGTAVSLSFINKLPRIATLRYSLLSMGILHCAVFVMLLVQSQWPENALWGYLAIALLFLFVVVFSVLFAGISLVYTSEVVDPRSRGIAIGLATAIGWVVNFTVSMASPSVMKQIGFYTFLVFTYICVGLYVAFGLMPRPHTVRSN